MKKLIILLIIPALLFVGCSGKKSGSGGEEIQDKTPGFHAELGKTNFSYKIKYFDENGRQASKIEILSITSTDNTKASYVSNPEPDNGTAEFVFQPGYFVYKNYNVSAQVSYEDGLSEQKNMLLTAFDANIPVSDNLSGTLSIRAGSSGETITKIPDITLINIENPGERPSFATEGGDIALTFPKEGLYSFDVRFSYEGIKYSHRYDMLMGGENFIKNSVKFFVNKAEGQDYILDIPITVTYYGQETYPSNTNIEWKIIWQTRDGSEKIGNSGNGSTMYFNAKTAYNDMGPGNYAVTAALSPTVNAIAFEPQSYPIPAIYLEQAQASPDGEVQIRFIGLHPEFASEYEAKTVRLVENGVRTDVPVAYPDSSVIDATVQNPSPDNTYAIEVGIKYNGIDYLLASPFGF